MALTLGFGYAAAMISAKIFPYQVESLGFHGTMWAHAAVSALMTLWALVALRNTDGLSLVEVERIYDKRVERAADAKGTTAEEGKGYSPLGMVRQALHKVKAEAVRKRSVA